MPKLKFIIIGSGPGFKTLKPDASLAPNIHELDRQPHEMLLKHLPSVKAKVVAVLEDFVIAHLEAIACVIPAISNDHGVNNAEIDLKNSAVRASTGVLVVMQTSKSFRVARAEFEDRHSHAQKFSIEKLQKRFLAEFRKVVL